MSTLTKIRCQSWYYIPLSDDNAKFESRRSSSCSFMMLTRKALWRASAACCLSVWRGIVWAGGRQTVKRNLLITHFAARVGATWFLNSTKVKTCFETSVIKVKTCFTSFSELKRKLKTRLKTPSKHPLWFPLLYKYNYHLENHTKI